MLVEEKEYEWLKKRVGCISASELNNLFSLSGKVTEANVDYIRKKRFERKHGYSLNVSSYAMEIGKEQESYAVEWFRENYPQFSDIIHANTDLDEIPFWTVGWAKFGASPDAFSPDETFVLEVKTVVSNADTDYYADEFTPYVDKYQRVKKEHGNQIAGQFLSNPKVEKIWLLKYIYQRDDDFDVDSPLEKWRGVVFEFVRSDFELEKMKDRIILFDNFIDAPVDPASLKTTK